MFSAAAPAFPISRLIANSSSRAVVQRQLFSVAASISRQSRSETRCWRLASRGKKMRVNASLVSKQTKWSSLAGVSFVGNVRRHDNFNTSCGIASDAQQPLENTARQKNISFVPNSFLGKLRWQTSLLSLPYQTSSTATQPIKKHDYPQSFRPAWNRGNPFISLAIPPSRGFQTPTTRCMSTNGSGSKDNKEKSTSENPSGGSGNNSLPQSPSTSERITEASKAVRQRVEQVEERLSKVLHDVVAVSAGDQLAVAAIVMLLVGLLAAPYVISQMKASNRNYDGLADTDDPVDDFTLLAQGEWEQQGDRTSALENLLSDVVQSKALQQAAQQFVLQIVQAPEVKQALQRLLVSLWTDLVQDPETIRQVIHLLQIVIQDEQIKAAAVQLVLDVVAEPEVQASLVAAVQILGNDSEVQKALQILLTNTAHQTLNDGEVLDHSMEFATDVLGDDVVQQTAGEALRNTVRHAFRPAASMGLTATGVALLVFGVLALGYARSSEQEARLLDTAARSLQTNAVYGMQRLVTWPVRTLQHVAIWIASTCWSAWKSASSSLINASGNLGQWLGRGMTYTGQQIATIIGQAGRQVVDSAWQTLQSGYQALFQVLGSLARGALCSIQHVWNSSNDSLLQWSWNVIHWGRHWTWQIGKWISVQKIQKSWQWLMEHLMGVFFFIPQ